MPINRRIYLLDPKKLSPETIAVTFAKTSRSPLPFDAIADELSDKQAANFHEKWVVGYGHSSVAEHAVLHIAVENISRLAIECLESNRLASYTEKSSRYQVWDADHFFTPAEFQDSTHKNIYNATCVRLFQAYESAFEIIHAYLMRTVQPGEDESERGFKTRVRSTCADVCRYFLPAASLANVGISINARALEHALVKMLSHPLQEVRAIGAEIKAEALKHVPTLVKYADPSAFLTKLSRIAQQDNLDGAGTQEDPQDWFLSLRWDRDGQDRILAALLYRFGDFSMQTALTRVAAMQSSQKAHLADQILDGMSPHDQPSREFELAHALFDLTLDQGAYFELKRHRMMAQTVQAFTPYLGYAMPKLFAINGLTEMFQKAMAEAGAAFETLAGVDPQAAAYVLPNAFNRRVLLNTNLRSAIHLIKLRCAPNAHFAIRRPVLRMAEFLKGAYPLFSRLLTPCTDETWQSVEEQFFTGTHFR